MIRVQDSEFYINFEHQYLLAPEFERYDCGRLRETTRRPPSKRQTLDALLAAGIVLGSGDSTGEDAHQAWHMIDDVLQQYENAEERHSHLTTCVLVDVREQAVLASGSSLCTIDDVFCKKVGRWYSLTRAIDNLSLAIDMNEEGREAFLGAYFDRPRPMTGYPNTIASQERSDYEDWLRAEFTRKLRNICPACREPIVETQRAVSIGKALHDGTIAGDIEVLRTYHDACLRAAA